MALAPPFLWPWVPAWGSLEPPRRDGENAQKTGKNGAKMGEIRPKKCGQGRERRDHLGPEEAILDEPLPEHVDALTHENPQLSEPARTSAAAVRGGTLTSPFARQPMTLTFVIREAGHKYGELNRI